MKNKLFILPFLIFIFVFGFNNKVEALTFSEHNTDGIYGNIKEHILESPLGMSHYNSDSKYQKLKEYKYSTSVKEAVYYDTENNNIILAFNSKAYVIPLETDEYSTENIFFYGNTYNFYIYLFNNETFNTLVDHTGYTNSVTFSNLSDCVRLEYTNKYDSIIVKAYETGGNPLTGGSNLSFNKAQYQQDNIISTFDIYYNNRVVSEKNFEILEPPPEIFINLKEDLKDSNDNIIGKVLQTSVSQLDNLKYNYYYRINDNEWNLIDSSNFVTNSFYYELKENGTFYFKIEDKEDNYINSSTFTTSGIDSFSSLESEEVNYEYINENGVKTTYNKLLKIPISSFYDFEYNSFKKFEFAFLSSSKENNKSDFLIKYHNKENSNGIDLPLHIKFYENIEDITKTSGGGGGHSFGSENLIVNNCKVHNLPFYYNIHNDNTNYYNVLQLIPTNCTNNFNYSLSDFRNDYIYVYYNARIYKNSTSIKEDYEINKDNFENDSPKSFLNSVTQALNYFLKPIKEIFKLVTYFFNSLPFQIRYMFMAVFVIGIILIVFKLFF